MKTMQYLLLILIFFSSLVFSSINSAETLKSWNDTEIDPINLEKLGFIIEYDRLPDHLDGDAKNEICISMPINIQIQKLPLTYSTSLLITDELSANIGCFIYKNLPRTIIEISDKLSSNAKIYICYQGIEGKNEFGYRYVLEIIKIIEYGKTKSAQQGDAPEPASPAR